jgi:hypothetical protein
MPDSRSSLISDGRLERVGDKAERFTVEFFMHIDYRDEVVDGGFIGRLRFKLDRHAEIARWERQGWGVLGVPNDRMRRIAKVFDNLLEATQCANEVWGELGCNADHLRIQRHARVVEVVEYDNVVSQYGPWTR